MGDIEGIWLIIIIQAIVFLLIIIGFLLFLLHSKNKVIKSVDIAPDPQKEKESLLSSVESYLISEFKLAESRFNLLFQEKDLQGAVFTEPDWIFLRKSFLEIEKEMIKLDDREDLFWKELGSKIKDVLRRSHLVKRIQEKEIEEGDEDEIKELKKLIKSQTSDFDELSQLLDGDKSAAEVAELKEKIIQIARSHIELSSCIFVLEDENMFLRDQIAALLK